jgi:hypothetical protein
MSVAKKQRRKLMRDDREFIWWVALDHDSNDMILHIVSDDKKFIAHYILGQQDQERLVIILGPEFSGATTGGLGSGSDAPVSIHMEWRRPQEFGS